MSRKYRQRKIEAGITLKKKGRPPKDFVVKEQDKSAELLSFGITPFRFSDFFTRTILRFFRSSRSNSLTIRRLSYALLM